jgi:hypothetical protein
MLQIASADWDLLVRQARHAGLLARLNLRAEELGIAESLPEAARAHLVSAGLHARAQADEARREIRHIHNALAELGAPVILLKGAAYLMAGHSPAAGRTFSDVDILVPKAALAQAESALLFHGWVTTHRSAYDQRYYREWMHELPPLEHMRRGTVLDVHHNILPEVARQRVPADKLIAASISLPGDTGLRVLAPEDMLLHSMVHLLHNEEMGRGLRDLSDLDLMLREFCGRPDFWERLTTRTRELGLERVLYYGLSQAHGLLGTPVPEHVLTDASIGAPSLPVRRLMAAAWSRALGPLHASATDGLTSAALALVFLRAHWLRMPAPLLARHLATKAWKRLTHSEGARNATP